MSDKTYYVCGTYVVNPETRQRTEFRLVRPTHGYPYVTEGEQSARRLFDLCSHHACLYRLEGERLILVRRGEDCDMAASIVTPEWSVMDSIRQAIDLEKLWKIH